MFRHCLLAYVIVLPIVLGMMIENSRGDVLFDLVVSLAWPAVPLVYLGSVLAKKIKSLRSKSSWVD